MNALELLQRVPAEYASRGLSVPPAVVQVTLTGPDGGQWVLRFQGGRCELTEGVDAAAGVRVTAGADDLVALAEQRLSPLVALSQGRLRVEGDWGLAMRLLACLKG